VTAPVATSSAQLDRPLTHRDILGISIPITLSNITTPLVGLADAAVIGQLGDATPMAGVTLASSLLTLLFWTFGFLRMGTSGMTAQAFGAGDRAEVAATLQRAIMLAVGLGLALVGLQLIFGTAWLRWMGGSPEATAAAGTYFAIRLWSGPFSFINYALIGWFIGQGAARTVLAIMVVQNIVNILLAIGFVLGFGWGVAGSAWAAFIAELVAVAVGSTIAWWRIGGTAGLAPWSRVFNPDKIRRTVAININIMIRTLCLEIAFFTFVARAAASGDVALAANSLLFHLFEVIAFFLDGFAHAAETFVGQAIGAKRRERLSEAVWLSSLWAGAFAVLISIALWLTGPTIIDLMTTSQPVRDQARMFLIWAVLAPVFGFAAFQLDGIFIGATRGADMRNMMIISLMVYLAAAYGLTSTAVGLGNHGLWLALMLFFLVRTITLGSRYPALLREAFG
jgi:multidrug resistance protein, MATE family